MTSSTAKGPGMFNRLFDLSDRFIMTGLGLVALYLVVVHPAAVNTLITSGFRGVNASFKTLQGR